MRTRTHNRPISVNLEKSLSRYALATATVAAVAIPVAAKADFSGPYAPGNWTLANTGGSDGGVNTGGAPASITLSGGDSGSNSLGTTNFTIAAVASGMVSFDWNYSSSDTSFYDQGNFVLNGAPVLLAFNDSPVLSGMFTTPVNMGDIFGFQVTSVDNTNGPGVLAISNFSGPLVPEGSTLSLLALGAIGVMIVMRRRGRPTA